MQRIPLRAVVECQCVLVCGLLLLVPEINGTALQLASAAQRSLTGKLAPVSQRVEAHLGEEALTPKPLELVRMARAQHLTEFSLSPGLASDPAMLQRVTEGAWPIQLDAHSRHLFLRHDETLPARCQIRQRGVTVDYADCG